MPTRSGDQQSNLRATSGEGQEQDWREKPEAAAKDERTEDRSRQHDERYDNEDRASTSVVRRVDAIQKAGTQSKGNSATDDWSQLDGTQ